MGIKNSYGFLFAHQQTFQKAENIFKAAYINRIERRNEMDKTIKMLSACVAVTLAFLLVSGCSLTDMTGNNYDLYIFNGKGESAAALDRAAKQFSEETGKKVKTFSLGSGTSSMDTLRAEMNSDKMPSIFSVVNIQELKEWEEGGFVLDFNTVDDVQFKKLADNIPEQMRLSSDGQTSYGVPYNVEGYGYIVDTRMIDALFGDGVSEKFLSDIKRASYEEFEKLVTAVDGYIKNDTAATVELGGASYTLRPAKTDLSKKLTGVFAVAGADKWTYGDHMVNVALNAVFKTPAEAESATTAQIESLKGPLVAYAKALDFKTGYAAGRGGPLGRGPEFINTTTANYDSAVQIFAESKALFIKQGNWAYTNIEKAKADIVETLAFVPIKLPLKASDVTASGVTPEKINSSISVYVPNYYVINAKATDEQKKTAMDFLVWLNESESGQKFVTEDMAFIPYNAEDIALSSGNSLSKSIISYMESGDVLSNPYGGAPVNWPTDVMGLEVMEKYLIKEVWTESDYEALADYGVARWKAMAGK